MMRPGGGMPRRGNRMPNLTIRHGFVMAAMAGRAGRWYAARVHPRQLAVQLYTVRHSCRTAAELAVTAQRVRSLGYTGVELGGLGPIPDLTVRGIMEAAGLEIGSAHLPPAEVRADPAGCLARLRTFGCSLGVFPFPEGVDLERPQAVATLAADLRRAAAAFRAAGCTLAYHHHAVELAGAPGARPLEVMLAVPELAAELDTYWLRSAGEDPAAWCRRVAGRLPAIHLKDLAWSPGGQPEMRPVGEGELDFPEIVAAAEAAGARWFIVEQDHCDGDPFDCLRRSREHLTELIHA